VSHAAQLAYTQRAQKRPKTQDCSKAQVSRIHDNARMPSVTVAWSHKVRMMVLDPIHDAIDACRVCEHLEGFRKPAPLARGAQSRVMVVGEAPGNTEISSGKAFSGGAGKRLFQWLEQCGLENPREQLYLTAAVKCVPGNRAQLKRMVSRCRRHLHAQLAAIRPQLVITVGELAYSELVPDDLPFSAAVCRLRRADEGFMLPPFGFPLELLAWPHPSGRSRWLNNFTNRDLLQSTFSLVRSMMDKATTK